MHVEASRREFFTLELCGGGVIICVPQGPDLAFHRRLGQIAVLARAFPLKKSCNVSIDILQFDGNVTAMLMQFYSTSIQNICKTYAKKKKEYIYIYIYMCIPTYMQIISTYIKRDTNNIQKM